MNAGDIRGSIIHRNTCIVLAPSILAALSRSSGMLKNAVRIRKTDIGILVAARITLTAYMLPTNFNFA